MKLSFVVILKNRIRLPYSTKDGTFILELLPNNFKSLCNLIKPDDEWEFVIIDFASTDANVDDFIKTTLTKPNMTYKLIRLEESFNKGKGLNMAIPMCTHDTVFCIDADMMIRTYDLFDSIQTLVIEKGLAFFPICYSYKNPEHTDGWERVTGTGNVIFKKDRFNPYIEKTSWGREDDFNHAYFKKLGIAVREYYGDKFVHQWHPKVWF
jgi:glycosyltransferase involved in cell wall biosynthesis